MSAAELLALADEMAEALANFRADAQLPPGDLSTALILAGFVERREITKPCRTCGTPRPDYSYFRVTEGGKLFLAAALRARAQAPQSPPRADAVAGVKEGRG